MSITLRDIEIHRGRLDDLTSTILSKSNRTVQMIEENMRLTYELRTSSSFIPSLDSKVESLSAKLAHYQHLLTQLNSLLIRSEFFEKQLQMYEAQQIANKARLLDSTCDCGQIRKDDELNWKTSEATLENLWLEFRFLSRKIDSDFNSKTYNTSTITARSNAPIESSPLTPLRTTNEAPEEPMTLKPIRCVSKREKSKRRSLNLNLLNYSPSMLNNPMMLTPDSSFNTANIFSESFQHDQGESLFTKSDDNEGQVLKIETPKKPCKSSEPIHIISPLSHKSNERLSPLSKRKRSNSVPHSISSLSLTPTTGGPKTPINAFLRHAVSLEAGLAIKKRQQSVDDDVTKDTQWLNSPVMESTFISDVKGSHDIGLITPNITPDNSVVVFPESKGDEYDVACKGDISLQNLLNDSLRKIPEPLCNEADLPAQESSEPLDPLPTFSHRLNRSNSCDSIFSSMTTRIPVHPLRDSKTQTMSWMQKFSSGNQRVSAKPTNVTTLSVNNLSISRNSDQTTKAALSSLVAQSAKPERSKATSNGFSFWFGSKKAQPSTGTVRSTTANTNKNNSPFANHTSTVASSPIPISSASAATSHKIHNRYETLETSRPQKPSESLFSRFNAQTFIPSTSLVTREVGRPVNESHRGVPLRKPHMAMPIKGSFSTLTIGANRSATVQHGEGSVLLQSSVVTSQISHAALEDALKSEFEFD